MLSSKILAQTIKFLFLLIKMIKNYSIITNENDTKLADTFT